MTTPSYRLVYVNMLTGQVNGEIPLLDCKSTEILNAPGSLQARIPLAGLTGENINPKNTVIYLQRDKEIIGGGIQRTRELNLADNTATISTEGWLAYLRERYLKVDLVQDQVDQFQIVKALIDTAQSTGDVNIDTSLLTTCGVLRDRSDWFWWKRLNIGKLIEDLAAVINGFHFRFYMYRIEESGITKIYPRIQCTYPPTGRPTNFIFEATVNCDFKNIKEDYTQLANNFEAIGSGQTAEVPLRDAVNTSELASVPLWEKVQVFSDVTEASTLQEKADRGLALGLNPIKQVSLTIQAFQAGQPMYSEYQCGDRVRVKGSYGLVDIDDDYLITQKSIDVKTEQVDINLIPIGALA